VGRIVRINVAQRQVPFFFKQWAVFERPGTGGSCRAERTIQIPANALVGPKPANPLPLRSSASLSKSLCELRALLKSPDSTGTRASISSILSGSISNGCLQHRLFRERLRLRRRILGHGSRGDCLDDTIVQIAIQETRQVRDGLAEAGKSLHNPLLFIVWMWCSAPFETADQDRYRHSGSAAKKGEIRAFDSRHLEICREVLLF